MKSPRLQFYIWIWIGITDITAKEKIKRKYKAYIIYSTNNIRWFTCLWVLRLLFDTNDFWHTSHVNGFSPLCVRSCVTRDPRSLNTIPQILQQCALSSTMYHALVSKMLQLKQINLRLWASYAAKIIFLLYISWNISIARPSFKNLRGVSLAKCPKITNIY